MGFYSPATIVKDAKRHGLKILPVCAMRSDWRCTIESENVGIRACPYFDRVRLGFCMARDVRKEHLLQMLEERARRPFTSLEDFKARTGFAPRNA